MTYDFKDLSVAVVDQSAYIARVTVGMLRVLEIRDIRTFNEIDELLSTLLSGKTDLILTELDMEPIDGLTLIRKVRGNKSDQIRFLPLVVTAGFATKRLVNQARNAGADDFLVKPFSVNTLYTRLVELTERRQPFVETAAYFGPDRRRKVREYQGPDRRRPVESDAAAPDSTPSDTAPPDAAPPEDEFVLDDGSPGDDAEDEQPAEDAA